MKGKLEKRNFDFEIRAEDSERGKKISGRPVVYESKTNLGPFDEVIAQGALNKTDLRDVRFLVNHDLSKIPLASSRRNNGNSTMQLFPILQGLDFEAYLDVERNERARELVSAIEREDLTGMSFMFSIDSEEWKDLESDHPTRRILEIGTIVEISACSFPAYDSTFINARNKEALENAELALEKARRNYYARKNGVDTPIDTLELLKEKTKIYLGGF